jgi:hypothetical protein
MYIRCVDKKSLSDFNVDQKYVNLQIEYVIDVEC